MLVGILVASIVLAFLLLVLLDADFRRERAFALEMRSRKPLEDAELVNRYYPTDSSAGAVAVEVRRIFASNTGYATKKLLPDDDLSFFWAEMDALELFLQLESTFQIKISEADAAHTPCTIHAVTQFIVRYRA